ncbi:MAG: ComEC family competence protein [Phycisphaeraceae bacterium]|nr:MAG: ComEC family competence protein [Phycisphaeraceae bacterium]
MLGVLRLSERQPPNPDDPPLPDLTPAPRAAISDAALRAWAAACCFALGIGIAIRFGHLLDPIWLALPAIVLAALSAIIHRKSALPMLGAALLLTGAAWGTLRLHTVPHDALERFLSDERSPITITGTVVDHPTITGSQRGALAPIARFDPLVTRCTVAVHSIETESGPRRVRGRLWLSIREPTPSLKHADHIRMTGFALPVRAPMNPGEIDFRPLARDRMVAGSISTPIGALVEPLEPPRRGVLEAGARIVTAPIHAIRARSLALIQAHESSHRTGTTLLAALLLGERDTRFDELASPFARTGLGHLLAISGLHLGILAGAGAVLIRCTGDRPRLESMAMITLALIALVLIPARTPIIRAVIILLALQPALWSTRRHDPLALLAWAACAVLLWRPTELTNPGAQLSFAVVGALIAFTRPFTNALFGVAPDPDHRTTVQSILRTVQEACSVAIVAWCVSLPIIIHHFGVLPLVGIPASLVLLPAFVLLLVLGYAVLTLNIFVPGLAELAMKPLITFSEWVAAAVERLDALPASSIHLPQVPVLLTLLAMVAIGMWFARPSLRRPMPIAALALLSAWIGWRALDRSLPDDVLLRIDALSVGDGSAYLIRSGNEAILYDCGSMWFGMGLHTVPNAHRALNAPSARSVIISHPDTDHYSALLDSARALGVRRVLMHDTMLDQARANTNSLTAFFIRTLERQSIAIETVHAGDTLSLGSLTVEFLWPPRDAEFAIDNDASLVVRLRIPTDAGERIVLFTGDIEREAMRGILAKHPELRADIIEAPHHGSAANPDAFGFVEHIDPGVVIQSTGPSRIDDPRWDKARAGRTWLVTARDGAVSVEVMRDGSIRAATYRGDAVSLP